MMTYDLEWFVYFTGLNALLVFGLAMNISRLRIVRKIPYGDGDSIEMNQAIRAHANGVEHVSLFAIILLGLSFLSADKYIIASLVILFSVARFAHAYGMLGRIFNARRLGALMTYFSEGVGIVGLFYLSVF